MEGYTDCTQDGGLKKKILKEGTGANPTKG